MKNLGLEKGLFHLPRHDQHNCVPPGLDSAGAGELWVCLQGWTAVCFWAVCAPPVQPEPAISSPPLLQPLTPVLRMCGCNYRNWADPVSLGICSPDRCKVGHWRSGSGGKVCPERSTDLHWNLHPCLLKDISFTLKHPLVPAGCRPCRLSVAFPGCQTCQHCATGCASSVAHSRTKRPLGYVQVCFNNHLCITALLLQLSSATGSCSTSPASHHPKAAGSSAPLKMIPSSCS